MALPSAFVVDECVNESLVGLCKAYEVEPVERTGLRLLRPSEGTDELADPVGTILFRGDGVSGRVSLSLPPGLVRAMWCGDTPDFADAMRDWTGELTNQLMGRLKNLLMGHGVALAVSTPEIVPASVAAQHDSHWSCFRTDTGETIMVGVGLGDAAAKELTAAIPPVSTEPMASEGELILF
jgi:hypothetical protein